ncbi:zinc-binding dehydrogenase [Mycobacterium sp.]|uniref:zinc-binding dehydrogenase n=1 Tax=Mycobacterium sp. TaxID=1785 RepID=UPI002D9F3699|nr:zinc-binding dehydrogenase [Mycobacterium sp.]
MTLTLQTVARLHGIGDVRPETERVPKPGRDEELVRVTAVGLCGSDVHWFTEAGIGDARLLSPVVPGHELAGVIEGGPRHGIPVAIDPALPCRQCDTCLRGDQNLCPDVVFAGHSGRDGGLQQYLVWPSWALHPLPSGIDGVDGAMLEPLGVALHALDLGHMRIGAVVVIVGAGPIGLLLLQALRRSGATRVVVVEPLAHRRDAALRYGADAALDVDEADEAALTDATGASGADVVFEMAGCDQAVEIGLRAARPGARVVLGGIPDGDRTSFPASLARRKGLTLVLVRRMNDAYPRAIRLVEHGMVDVSSIVTHRYPLDRVTEAFAMAARRGGLKVVVEPGA